METFFPDREIRVAGKEDLWQVRALAEKIFPVTYEKIVESEAIAYMMDLFYTPEALVSQQNEGQVFLLAYNEGKPVGFASYSRVDETGTFKLNKIYLDSTIQGRGLGKWLLNDIISRVKSEGARILSLNVNRLNKAAGFYKIMGFTVLREDLVDIGQGFFMDDFLMQRVL